MCYKLLVVNFLFMTFARGQQKEPVNNIELKSFIPDHFCNKRFFNFGNLQITQTSAKETRLSGAVHLLQDIGRRITMESRLFRNLRGQESEEMAYQFVTICNDLADANALWPITVVPSYRQCPIRKGAYNVTNFTVSEGMLQSMPRENHHVETSIFRDGVRMCGAKLVFDVVFGK